MGGLVEWLVEKIMVLLMGILLLVLILCILLGVGYFVFWDDIQAQENAERRAQSEVIAKIFNITPNEAYTIIPLIKQQESGSTQMMPVPLIIPMR